MHASLRIRSRFSAAVALIPFTLLVACGEQPSAPATQAGALTPSLARLAVAGNACVANPSIIVSTEAQLVTAAAHATPGTIIAIQGTISMHGWAQTNAPDVTFTCAAPGDGLRFAPNAAKVALLRPFGDRDVVQGLTLDATGGNDAVTAQATDGERMQFNTVTCGGSCVLWSGTTNALIADNTFMQSTSGPGTSGVHLQSIRDANGNVVKSTDGTHIERNTVTALAPTGDPLFGAIRPRDGTGLVVADNVISGPWSNGISVVNVNASEFTHNVISGPRGYGFIMNVPGSVDLAPSVADTAIANRVSAAGVAGYWLNQACFNVFRGNPSLGSTPVAFQLAASTGGNIVEGTAGRSVDDGALDCDGDGHADHNTVSGK